MVTQHSDWEGNAQKSHLCKSGGYGSFNIVLSKKLKPETRASAAREPSKPACGA